MPITFHQLTDQDHMVQLPNFQVESIEALFAPAFLNSHPYINQKNIFYTASSVALSDRNSLLEQTIIPFDVDNIPEHENKDFYIAIFSQFTGIPTSDFITVNTGHGLHLIVRTEHPIKDEVAFLNLRKSYHYTCAILDEEFSRANLTGKMDRNIFKKKQLLRLPNTINHKPKKYAVDSLCTYVSGKAVPQPLDLLRLSGADKHAVPQNKQVPNALPPADTEAVMAGCDFIKMCAGGAKLSEPQWYGMLGILSKCKDGRVVAHDISRLDHARYDSHQTDRKFDQADDACRGRLCTSIMELWDGCATCPNFNKVTTPLVLRGTDYIATEHTNFHYLCDKGVKKGMMVPAINDLVKYLVREKNYILFPMKNNKVETYHYNGKYWEYLEPARFGGQIKDLYRPDIVSHTEIEKTVSNFQLETSAMQKGRPTDPSEYMSLSNGDFSLRTLEFVSHDKTHKSFSYADYSYDPTAKCPKFNRFMSEGFTSQVYIDNVLEFFASAMFNLPNHTYDKCLVLHGPKDNGKSVLARVMTEVFGLESVSAEKLSEESFNSIGGLTTVVGKKLNISEEADWDIFSSPQFKNVVTGGLITVNPKNIPQYTTRFSAKLLFCANSIPKAYQDIDAIAKRVMLCHMPNVYSDNDPRQNKNLGKEICADELPGVFNLVIEAGRRVIARGKYDTSTVEYQQMKEEFTIAANDVLAWATEHLESNDACNESVADIYKEYTRYCETNGMRTENSRQFGKTMKTRYPTYSITTNVNGKSIKMLKGYRLLKEDYDGAF